MADFVLKKSPFISQHSNMSAYYIMKSLLLVEFLCFCDYQFYVCVPINLTAFMKTKARQYSATSQKTGTFGSIPVGTSSYLALVISFCLISGTPSAKVPGANGMMI